MQLNNQPASTSYSYFFSPDSCGGLVCEPELAAALAAPVWPELAAALAASGSGSTGSTGGCLSSLVTSVTVSLFSSCGDVSASSCRNQGGRESEGEKAIREREREKERERERERD